jgi:hypothetical protein
MREHLGWSTKGRLPHFDSGETTQFITFGLADSLPASALTENADQEFDRGRGECLLSIPKVAELVVVALQHFHASRYQLLAYVVMPNHVHVLITQGKRPSPRRYREIMEVLHIPSVEQSAWPFGRALATRLFR